MKLVVLDGYTENPGDLSWDALKEFGDLTVYDRTSFTESPLITERIGDAEIIITNKTPISRETIDKCPRIKLIAALATGYNVIDYNYAAEKGIPVVNVPTYGTASVSQFSIALLLEICHHIGHHDKTVHEGKWAENIDWCYWDYPLIELEGKTMGIIGFGRIGQAEGRIAKALGMNVIAYDLYPNESGRAIADYVTQDELFAKADVISLHCNLTPENAGLINRENIAKMKDGVRIVNFARGDLVNSKDILEALQNGKVAAYATDFPSDELIGESGVIAIPHLGASTPESEDNCAAMAADELKDYLEEGVIRNSVNLPNVVLPRSADTRICLIHKNVPSMLNQITATLTEKNVNIDNMINKSKKAFAYTVIDTNDAIGDDTLAALSAIEGIVRVRVIR